MSDLDISRLRVLIVEDSSFTRRILAQYLRVLHVRELVEAEDGADAIEKLRTFDPDIILVDWEMQRIDGLDLVKMVRTGKSGSNKFVPIIMVTAHSEVYRITEARDAGINELLIKPLSASMLYSRIKAVIQRPRPYVEAPNYFGPDRRRRKVDYEETDRRKEEPELSDNAVDKDAAATQS